MCSCFLSVLRWETAALMRLLQIMAGGRRKRMQKSMASSSRSDNQNTASDLPFDLLELIFSLLTLRDCIRASAVCRNWLAVAASIRVPNSPPWLLSFPKSGDWYQLYDPSTRAIYYMEYPELHGCRICYAKDGWLLAFKHRTKRLFAFHPYTRQVIKFPKNRSALDNVCLSAAPTSPGCILFTIRNISPTAVAICISRTGDTEWDFMLFHNNLPFLTSVWNKIVFCKGVFFCLGLNDTLALFDPENCMWLVSVVPRPRCMEFSYVEQWRRGKFLVEHDGDIFVVYTCGGQTPFVYKLDETKGVWKEISSLGGVTLFANSLASVGRSDFHGSMRGKVYFSKILFFGKRCVAYSLESDRYYPRNRYYDWGEEDLFDSVWIDPPQDTTTLLRG